MSTWYYADAQRQRLGPVDTAELARLLGVGQLQWTSLVWRDGMADWRPLADFADEIQAAAPSPAATTFAATAAPAASGGDALYAPPSAPLLHDGGIHAGGEVVYAGFWKRTAAYLIDGFILGIAGYAIQLPLLLSVGAFGAGADGATPAFGPGFIAAMAAAYLLPILLQMVYSAWFHASGNQATLGKMAVGIKVVRESGARITFARGVGRYFAVILSSLTLCIGFVMAAFTERKRALHDMICDTLVVDKWAFTSRPELQEEKLGVVTIVVLALGALLVVGLTVAMIGMVAVIANSGGLR